MIQNKNTEKFLSDLWERLRVRLHWSTTRKKIPKPVSVYLHISPHKEGHEFETFSTMFGTQQVFNKCQLNEYMTVYAHYLREHWSHHALCFLKPRVVWQIEHSFLFHSEQSLKSLPWPTKPYMICNPTIPSSHLPPLAPLFTLLQQPDFLVFLRQTTHIPAQGPCTSSSLCLIHPFLKSLLKCHFIREAFLTTLSKTA